ncbi:diaminopimelate decarboxylase [Candidatus Poribacteria bacterium]|nr:diaminopimelate decarboxylase [Candidatus Poribacteria bacterium]
MTPREGSPVHANGILTWEGVALDDLAGRHGTPLFVYSAQAIRANFRRIQDAFAATKPLIAYSVKANSNGALLRLLALEGAAFDIVSGGELERVRRAGAEGSRMIFAGVGKTREEMRAALECGVLEFNIESAAEAERLEEVAAESGRTAPVALRVNPDVDPRTHAYISTGKKENKFGLDLESARALVRRLGEFRHLRFEGLHAHIGSQILDPEPYRQAAGVLDEFLAGLKAEGFAPKTLNLGGGFGIAYHPGHEALDLRPIGACVGDLVWRHGLRLILEPGRAIIGAAGLLLTRVEYVKRGMDRTFVIVDASMTENIRPALYSAHHEIVPVREHGASEPETFDVVGPVCESADFLALARKMPRPTPGEVLAIRDCGAYCFAMASNYNSRRRPAEVLLDGGVAHLIRERETLEDLVRLEVVPVHLREAATAHGECS